MELKKDVKYVKGVGPNRVQLLNKLNIFTLGDLITLTQEVMKTEVSLKTSWNV